MHHKFEKSLQNIKYSGPILIQLSEPYDCPGSRPGNRTGIKIQQFPVS